MKRTIVAILSILLVFSLLSSPAYGAGALDKEKETAKQMFEKKKDEEVLALWLLSLVELNNRGIFTDKQAEIILGIISATNDVDGTSPAKAKEASNSIYVPGSVGNFYIELTSWKIQKDYEGKPTLVLSYTWTNNSSETTMPSFSTSVTAYQNGISLDSVLSLSGVDLSSGIKNVQPGYSIDVQEAFKLSNTDSDVEIEVKPLWNVFDSSEPLRTTIHIK